MGHFSRAPKNNQAIAASLTDPDGNEREYAYTYDTTGALQTKTDVTDPFDPNPPTTTYTYDDFGNLRHVALPDGRSIDYLIDATQRRVGRVLKDTSNQVIDERRWLYQSGLRPIAELDGNNQVQSFFVYADKPNLPEYMERGGQKYRIITDHLGSLRLVAHTSTGEIKQRMLHDENGNVVEDYVASGWDPVPFGFAGGIYDRDTGLVRFGARDFDPQTARWSVQDPIGFGGGDGNLYGYVIGDPINFIDPDGHYMIPPGDLSGAGARIDWGLGVINLTKVLVSAGNAINAGRLYATGSLKLAAAAGLEGVAPENPVSAATVALGLYNIRSATKAWERSVQLAGESVEETWNDGSRRNWAGLFPFGQYVDDPDEPTPWDFYREGLRDNGIIEIAEELGAIWPF